MCSAAVKAAHRIYLNVSEPEPVPLELSPEDLTPYVGKYESRLNLLQVELKEGSLVVQANPKGGFPKPDTPPPPAPPPTRIGLYAPDRAIGLESPYKGTRMEFLRDSSGNIVWLRVGGRVHRREA